jgi:hypothetical protein
MLSTAPKGLEVIKASYGAENATQDVTKEVKALVKDDSLNFTVDPNTFHILDPAPGVKKTLQVQLSVNGGQSTTIPPVEDGKLFVFNSPTPKKDEVDRSATGQLSTTLWYSFVALVGAYFAFSAYKLGSNGFKSSLLGWVLGFIIALSFIQFATAGSGVLQLIVSLPSLLFVVFFVVFAYSLFDPNAIDFNYGQKTLQSVVPPGFLPPPQ